MVDPKPKSESGFSSFELGTAMAAVMILSVMALPVFHSFRDAYALEGATYALYVDLQEARLQAIKRNKTITFTFDVTASKYQSSEGGPRYLANGVSFASVSANPSFSSRGSATATTIRLSNSCGTKDIDINPNGRIKIN